MNISFLGILIEPSWSALTSVCFLLLVLYLCLKKLRGKESGWVVRWHNTTRESMTRIEQRAVYRLTKRKPQFCSKVLFHDTNIKPNSQLLLHDRCIIKKQLSKFKICLTIIWFCFTYVHKKNLNKIKFVQ